MSRTEHGIGVDCTDTARWRRLLRSGRLARLFSPREHAQCASDAVKYARCWCAKEAVYKALFPHAPADLRKIEVLMDRRGQPKSILLGRGASPAAVQVSLSNTADAAMAVAFARKPGR